MLHKRKSFSLFLLFLLSTSMLIFLHNIPVSAATELSLFPIADAHVSNARGDKDSNFGGWYEIEISNCENMFQKEHVGYIKFAISGLPSNAKIESASLGLYCTYATETHIINVGCLSDDSWDEYTITWNNRPYQADKLIGSQTVAEWDNWYGWDVTEVVKEEFEGDKTITFVVYTTTHISIGYIDFASKEYFSEEAAPTLVIYYSVPKQSSQISCHLSSDSIVLGEGVTISGSINPARSATVTIEIFKDSQKIETETRWASGGSYSFEWAPTEAGSYKIRSSWDGDTEYYGDASSDSYLTVTEKGIAGIGAGTIIGALILVGIVAVGGYFVYGKFLRKK